VQVKQNERRVLEEIEREEAKFLETISTGEGMLDKCIDKAKREGKPLDGAAAFQLYDSSGFPLELTKEMAEAKGVTVDEAGFAKAMQEQKQRSKACPSQQLPGCLRVICLEVPPSEQLPR
jgi:alanyl-tRNA synthetase